MIINKKRAFLKELRNLYSIHYLRAVIILLSVGLYQSAFSTYSYVKLDFRPLFWFFVLLYLSLIIFLCFEFDVTSKDIISFL